MTETRRSRWLRILKIGAVLLVLGLIAGWAVDHRRQQVRLNPLRTELAGQHAQFKKLQGELLQARYFDGFDRWEEIIEAIESSVPYPVFERQAEDLAESSDAVFDEAIPKLIRMLDDSGDVRRQRAWRLLQCARESPRFSRYEASYRTGIVALLHHPSIRGFSKLLPWLSEQKMNSPEVLAGLQARMMDDNDPFAPYAAYTLAELDPTADIAPRLLEMIETKHSQWKAIIHRLPNYMPEDEAQAIFEKYRISR